MPKEPLPLPKSTPTPPAPSPATDLSHPTCPAEHCAWILIYKSRIGTGKRLLKAFSAQFPKVDKPAPNYHAQRLENCDEGELAQLRELAKGYEWYKEPPKEGEIGYKTMMNVPKQEAAKKRLAEKKVEKKVEGMVERMDFEGMVEGMDEGMVEGEGEGEGE